MADAKRDFHTIVIGAGSGGITVAVGLAGFDKRVAIIEKAHVGGDCTNVGCVPSKTLIHLAKHMQENGMSASEVLAKVREHRDELREEETEWLTESEEMVLIKGEAKFKDAHTLTVNLEEGGTRTLSAENIVIASGSRPVRIPVEGLPDERYLTNEDLFDLGDMPKHLAIVGAGVIGSEMAMAFRTLGSEVTLLDLAPRILGVLEPEVSELLYKRMTDIGITIHTGTKGDYYDEKKKSFILDKDGERITLKGVDKVLIAIGRTPNLDLNMEAAGVEYSKKGIVTDRTHHTNVKHIYAIGDVDPNSAFTHSANAQGRRVVQKIALPFLPQSKEPVYPSATFTTPEIAQVGPALSKLKEQYHADLIKTYKVLLKDTDRGFTQFFTEDDGFVLVHAMALTGRVLSATIVAPTASEMIAPLTLAVNGGPRMYGLASLVFPYPVLSEAIKKTASNYTFETLPNLQNELKTYLSKRWATLPEEQKN